MDLEKLDLEEVDKEMAADEAAQSSAIETAPQRMPLSQAVLQLTPKLVFVTASPAPRLAERKIKHFPFSDRIPILRI